MDLARCALLSGSLLVGIGCGSDGLSSRVAPPGADEPVFDPARDTILFGDGFESYASAADLTSGAGSYTYVTGGDGLDGVRIVSGGAAEGSRKVEFDYQGTGEVSHILETYEVNNATATGPRIVVVSWLMRNVGEPYEGKVFIVFPQSAPRFLHHASVSRPYPDDIRACFWNSSNNPLQGGTPPGQALLPTWNRDDTSIPTSGPDAHGGYSYKQNRGWGAGGFQWTNAIADGNWHRFTTRMMQGATYGQGRLEMWADGIKIMEYVGDDPARCEFGIVYAPRTTQALVNGFQFPGPAAFNWSGGATIEFDALGVWTGRP